MGKRRIHRVAVYLLDTRRKRVLLHKPTHGPFTGQYVALSTGTNEQETPIETARKLVSETTHLDFFFLGHGPSMPMVLDERSVKLFPPLHVQLTAIDENTDYVDYVYLGQVRAAPEFPQGDSLGWYNKANLKNSPNHVKHLVIQILTLMA